VDFEQCRKRFLHNTIPKVQTIVQTNQKIKSAMFSKKTIFPPKKMYVPPYYDKISSKSERVVVERGTHDISLNPHHLYRIPKLCTFELRPKLQIFYKGFTK